MRERLINVGDYFDDTGITPAYAGKTFPTAVRRHNSRDHPRVCGKDPNYGGNLDLNKGSPPRMRERLQNLYRDSNSAGITPAYAGKTGVRGCVVIGVWDHPRVCGKDSLTVKVIPLILGSPPRMRERPRCVSLTCL